MALIRVKPISVKAKNTTKLILTNDRCIRSPPFNYYEYSLSSGGTIRHKSIKCQNKNMTECLL